MRNFSGQTPLGLLILVRSHPTWSVIFRRPIRGSRRGSQSEADNAHSEEGRAAEEPGSHLDSHGLYLQIVNFNNKSWLLRYERGGRERWYGLGPLHTFSLKEARERARAARQLLHDGIDPIDHRRAERSAKAAAKATALTFAEAPSATLPSTRPSGRRPSTRAVGKLAAAVRLPAPGPARHGRDRRAACVGSLEQKVPAAQSYPAGTLWSARTKTADRVRNRIESVLSWAAARGHCPKGPNPAAWAGNLEHTLPAPSKVARVQHHPAMHHGQVPLLMAELTTHEGVGARALAFTILTAARSDEALGATWDEINLAEKVWTIPAARMKSRREHRVPLAPHVVALLDSLYRESDNRHLFVGTRRRGPATQPWRKSCAASGTARRCTASAQRSPTGRTSRLRTATTRSS